MLNRLITFSVALPIVALPLGVPIAAALDPTSAQAAQGARFVEGLSVSVHRGANNQVVVVAHRMSNGGIRYPWSFQMKAQVGERVIRVTAPAGYDGGEAVHEFPPNTEWVAVRDDLSGWKRKAPPPGDPSIRYYPGAFFLRVSETGIPARWNPCATHMGSARTGHNTQELAVAAGDLQVRG